MKASDVVRNTPYSEQSVGIPKIITHTGTYWCAIGALAEQTPGFDWKEIDNAFGIVEFGANDIEDWRKVERYWGLDEDETAHLAVIWDVEGKAATVQYLKARGL